MATFEVSQGATLIRTHELLAWIADTAEPPDSRPPTLEQLEMQVEIGVNQAGHKHWRQDELTIADWQMLDVAWQGLPPVAGATKEEWPKYLEALELWKRDNPTDAPLWRLIATFTDHAASARVRRLNVLNGHFWRLRQLVTEGKVRALDARRLPTTTLDADTSISVGDARQYLQDAGHTLYQLPHFVTSARPLEVPAALLALPDDARVSYEHNIARQRGSGITNAADYRDSIRDTMARQAEGHFTLNEAAQVLADSRPGLDPRETVKRFRLAHSKGELPIHQGRSRFPLEVGETVRDFWDTVKVSELDAWLLPSVGYGFPRVEGANLPNHALHAAAVTGPALTHALKSRAEPLAAVLSTARAKALDPNDWQSGWAALVVLAQSPVRPAPLLGYSEGEGVKYQKDDANEPIGWLTRDAYRKRQRRRK